MQLWKSLKSKIFCSPLGKSYWLINSKCLSKTVQHMWKWAIIPFFVSLNQNFPSVSSFEVKKSGDQFPWKVTTCSRHYKPRLILPLKSVLLYNLPFTLKITFEKMKLFKVHQIIKLTCPSRQLFIKITFAFMKFFDFLVKIAIFGAFLFWLRHSRHALLSGSSIAFGQ